MKIALTLSFSLFLSLLFAASSSFAADGAGVFTNAANKCNECHAVKSAGIKLTGSDEGPDLSDAGKKDSKWIAAFISKEESLNGKKHRKGFKGNADELKTVSDWLATLKK